jgi:hypothetical protein
MDTDSAPNPRPYWHVDAKWITGLLLTFVLSLTLLVFNLSQVTQEKSAIDTVSTSLALVFSRQGLDDEQGIEDILKQLQASPDDQIQPIPGLRIFIREQDIANLSPREMRLYFFRQLAEPLYRQGPQGVMALAQDPEMQKGIAEGMGLLGFFTLETHQKLQRVLMILGIASFLLLLLLVLFSYKFGRIGSPGCVLLAASLPGALLFTFASQAVQPVSTPPGDEAGMSGMISYLVANLLPPLLQIIARNYQLALALGLGLMILSILGGLIWRLARRATH